MKVSPQGAPSGTAPADRAHGLNSEKKGCLVALCDPSSGMLAMDVTRDWRVRNAWAATLALSNVLLICMQIRASAGRDTLQSFIVWLLVSAIVAPVLCMVFLQGNSPRQSRLWNLLPISILVGMLAGEAHQLALHQVPARGAKVLVIVSYVQSVLRCCLYSTEVCLRLWILSGRGSLSTTRKSSTRPPAATKHTMTPAPTMSVQDSVTMCSRSFLVHPRWTCRRLDDATPLSYNSTSSSVDSIEIRGPSRIPTSSSSSGSRKRSRSNTSSSSLALSDILLEVPPSSSRYPVGVSPMKVGSDHQPAATAVRSPPATTSKSWASRSQAYWQTSRDIAQDGTRVAASFMHDLNKVPIIIRASYIITSVMAIVLLVVGGLLKTGVIQLPTSIKLTRKMVSSADWVIGLTDAAAPLFQSNFTSAFTSLQAANVTKLEKAIRDSGLDSTATTSLMTGLTYLETYHDMLAGTSLNLTSGMTILDYARSAALATKSSAALINSVIVTAGEALAVTFMLTALFAFVSHLGPVYRYTLRAVHVKTGLVHRRANKQDDMFPLRYMPMYMGIHIGSFFTGVLLVLWWTFLLVFTTYALKSIGFFLVIIIFQHFSGTVVTYILSYIVKYLFMELKVYDQYCSDGQRIKRPVPFAWMTLALTFYGIVSGFVYAGIRLVMLIFYNVHLTFQYDESPLPPQFRDFDAPYSSYWAVLQFDALHNHAAMLSAANTLTEAARERAEIGRPARFKRWKLAYTLLKNPTIVKFRVRRQEGQQQAPFSSSEALASPSLAAVVAVPYLVPETPKTPSAPPVVDDASRGEAQQGAWADAQSHLGLTAGGRASGFV